MEFKNTKVYNFEGAFRGLRNPMNSWDRSDSSFGLVSIYDDDCLTDVADAWMEHDLKPENDYAAFGEYMRWLTTEGILEECATDDVYNVAFLGPKDYTLARQLIRAGNEHAKFMRQIFVSVDITAPLYWWKEFDTYKVGTVANSTSTMHKLSAQPITKEAFEFDDNINDIIVSQGKSINGEWELVFSDYVDDIVDMCENLRLKFNETADSAYWRALIQILPNAYLQTRTITMSYANLRNIYFQRKNHKLKEWHQFCEEWIPTLPYAKDLILLGGKDETN